MEILLRAVRRTLHGTQYTHRSVKHMLPQHKAQRKLPEDGPDGSQM
jgi:hypothetical protein